jgi:undecaprenyl-diphosphatase
VALLHPRLRLPAFGLAALVALSRVYLGVHYWLDIAAGAALGVLIGLATVRASTWAFARRRDRPTAAPG